MVAIDKVASTVNLNDTESTPKSNSCSGIDKHPPKINLKRLKRLLLIFLKQFDADEFKFLINYMDILFIKFLNDPLKILVYLTTDSNNSDAEVVAKKEEEDATDITYLDEYKCDIIESFLLKENDEESPRPSQSEMPVKSAEAVSDEDDMDDFNYYHYNREEENSSSDSTTQEVVTTKKSQAGKFDSMARVRKFSDSIRGELERKFLKNNFISGPEKTKLAVELNLTERQVQKWFVHRREKLRRRRNGDKEGAATENVKSESRSDLEASGEGFSCF